jgi:hypothetical protein
MFNNYCHSRFWTAGGRVLAEFLRSSNFGEKQFFVARVHEALMLGHGRYWGIKQATAAPSCHATGAEGTDFRSQKAYF